MSIHSTGQSKDSDPLIVKPSGACRMLNCGRTHLYALLRAGEIDSLLDGRSRKVVVQSIHQYIQRKLAANVGTTWPSQKQDEARRAE